jgi:hypothetical protein
MQHELLREAVSQRVDELFIPQLFEKLETRHTTNRKTFKDCDCSYCELKKDATHYIGCAAYPPDYDGVRLPYYDSNYLSYDGQVDMRRHYLRLFFRNKLQKEMLK